MSDKFDPTSRLPSLPTISSDHHRHPLLTFKLRKCVLPHFACHIIKEAWGGVYYKFTVTRHARRTWQ